MSCSIFKLYFDRANIKFLIFSWIGFWCWCWCRRVRSKKREIIYFLNEFRFIYECQNTASSNFKQNIFILRLHWFINHRRIVYNNQINLLNVDPATTPILKNKINILTWNVNRKNTVRDCSSKRLYLMPIAYNQRLNEINYRIEIERHLQNVNCNEILLHSTWMIHVNLMIKYSHRQKNTLKLRLNSGRRHGMSLSFFFFCPSIWKLIF